MVRHLRTKGQAMTAHTYTVTAALSCDCLHRVQVRWTTRSFHFLFSEVS